MKARPFTVFMFLMSLGLLLTTIGAARGLELPDAKGPISVASTALRQSAERASGDGQTGGWTASGPFLGLSTLVLAHIYPQTPVMWLGTDNGLWRSGDGGETWERVTAGLDPALDYVALALSPGYPTDGRALTAGWGDDEAGTLFRSSDGGATWTAIASLSGAPTITLSPAFDQDGVAFVAASESGLLRSQDGGLTWTTVPQVPNPLRVALSPDFAHDGLAYVLTASEDVWRSTDGGQTWHQADFQASVLAFSPGFAQDRTLFQGWLNLYRSTDGGATWELIRPYASGVLRAVVLSPAFPQDGVLFLTEAIQPHSSPVKVSRSDDGGLTWTQVAEGGPSWNDFARRGLPVLSSGFAQDGVAFIPTDLGIDRSDDGGVTWAFWRLGWGRFRAWHLARAGDALVAAGGNAIFRSDDGQSWRVLTRFTESWAGGIAALAPSPGYPTDGRLVVSLCIDLVECMVTRSDDGGVTWQRGDPGTHVAFSQDGAILLVGHRDTLIRYRVADWAEMDRTRLGWSISALMVVGERVFVGRDDGAIFRSDDNGASWTQVGTVPPPLAWLSLAGDWFYAGPSPFLGGSVYRSADEGATWVVAPVPPWPVSTVTADSEGILYAATIGGGVYRSTDDGDTWIAWNAGLDAPWHHGAMEVYTLVPGPDGGMYAGTARGVWHLTHPGSFYLVNTTDDLDDGICDSAHCSLREALNAANATYLEDPVVAFNIPATDPGYDPTTGEWTIRPVGALPVLAPGNITLDGTTQADHQGNTNPLGPEIELDGSAAGPGVDGLTVAGTSMGNTIRGLVINGWSGAGIRLAGPHASSNAIVGNYIGTDAQGRLARPNGNGGILLDAASFNTVGGDRPVDRNLISGNQGSGVVISGGIANAVLGNFIGTDASGTQPVANTWAGVLLLDETQSNTIGGWKSGQGNLISGNAYGVQLAGLRTLDNVIQGNLIGTDAGGATALPNGIGVSIRGAWRTVVRDNTVSGNTNGGIHLWEGATSNTIVGNCIGTGAGGVGALGNGFYGINVVDGARLNRIGGPGEGNRIAYNAGNGVAVVGSDTAGNAITGNSITANDGEGIVLADGGNGELPAPVISMTEISRCVVSGTVRPNTRIEIFSDPEDEGAHYEGSTTADQLGRFWWRGGFRGPNVTATATDTAGNTSEFAVPVAGACHVVYLSLVMRVQ